MKTYKLIPLLLLFLFAQAVSLKAQTNLVTNGSFEEVGDDDLPTGWECSGINVIFKTVTDVNEIPDGTKALNVDVTGTSGSARDVCQGVAIVPGETYTFSFFYNVYRTPSRTDAGLSFAIGWKRAFSEYGEFIYGATYTSDVLPYVLDMWIPIEFEVEAPEEADTLYIDIITTRNIGVYIDNVQVFGAAPVATKQDQSISGLSDIAKTVSAADFDLSATASSGLAVSYTSSNTAVATVSGSTVHIVGAGTSTITASQAGNDDYNPAPDVTATLTVSDVSGIGEIRLSLPVRVSGGELIVTAPAGNRIEVFSAIGVKQGSTVSAGGETVLPGLPKGQVLIVRSGSSVAKVIL
jgi:hypothetical protein